MVKIFRVIGIGDVICEDLTRDPKQKDHVTMGYPMLVQMFQGEQSNQIGYRFVPIISPVYNDHASMMEKLQIQNGLILFGGLPSLPLSEAYLEKVKEIKAALSGITLEKSDVLDRLPRHADGSPRLPGWSR